MIMQVAKKKLALTAKASEDGGDLNFIRVDLADSSGSSFSDAGFNFGRQCFRSGFTVEQSVQLGRDRKVRGISKIANGWKWQSKIK